ncbi:MAG: hypothetical protein EOO40_01925 [Deltaproteobacteria bacterium]|nr:MAG: hypothetical protein EOO40_01925 [Deltaproteobacteria bacterium]
MMRWPLKTQLAALLLRCVYYTIPWDTTVQPGAPITRRDQPDALSPLRMTSLFDLSSELDLTALMIRRRAPVRDAPPSIEASMLACGAAAFVFLLAMLCRRLREEHQDRR